MAEEGLDIPSVDLVVFYEPVPSEIRFIQRRGRTGRLAAGRAVILMAKNTRDEAYYWTSVSKEKKMHKILHRMKSQNTARKEEETVNGNDSQTASENSTGKKESEDFIEDSLQKKAGREKQTTLHSFAPEDPGKIIVYVDARERDSGVAKMLQ